MQRTDKIYLIGFMGSGKSTTGRELAQKLNWVFVDLDEEIEKKTGTSIREIFSQKGEPFFRLTEYEALKETQNISKAVISTGGGTPCFGENMEFMQGHGLTVYLKLSPNDLEKRLESSNGERPLLEGIDKGDLNSFIARKLEEREEWYLRADIVIDASETGLSGLFRMVKKLLI